MSADNWGICPACKRDALIKLDVAAKKAVALYGKVPAEEYKELLRAGEQEPDLPESFREDREVGMSEDGEFFVSYRGQCQDCNFTHVFTCVI